MYIGFINVSLIHRCMCMCVCVYMYVCVVLMHITGYDVKTLHAFHPRLSFIPLPLFFLHLATIFLHPSFYHFSPHSNTSITVHLTSLGVYSSLCPPSLTTSMPQANNCYISPHLSHFLPSLNWNTLEHTISLCLCLVIYLSMTWMIW